MTWSAQVAILQDRLQSRFWQSHRQIYGFLSLVTSLMVAELGFELKMLDILE